jgi:tellurite methyltransferase
MHWKAINKIIGNIDIYWLDFILKGHLADDAKVLDIGCGEGRNIQYLLQHDYDVFGVDIDPLAIKYLRLLAKANNTPSPEARFQLMNAQKLLFPAQSFDVVISSAVLHFSKSNDEFFCQWDEMLRVLKPGGLLFIRTMTDHFLENSANRDSTINQGVYKFPSGERRFLVSDELMKNITLKGNVDWIEPSKYVNVSGSHTMGVFVLEKK